MIIENFQDKHLLKLSLKKNFYKKKINCEVCNSRNFSSLQNIGRIGRPGEYGLLNTVICLNCSFKYYTTVCGMPTKWLRLCKI